MGTLQRVIGAGIAVAIIVALVPTRLTLGGRHGSVPVSAVA